jgi:pimeloyl-ACP methyl ester carboxylesterase
VSAAFHEQAMLLGPQENLVGIVSLPTLATTGRPTVVVLNAGVLHRVGPHRMHVHLARRLAALGFACLRLDLAGIGDSLAVAGSQSFRESAVADTRAAMNDLARTLGSERFVLVGLCSGADNALAAALADERVAAIVVLDPPAYPTRRSRARKLARRIAILGPVGALRWSVAVADRTVRARLQALRAPAGGGPAPEEGRETPPLPVYRRDLRTLVDRGVKVLSIYSGSLGDRYNDADQLFEVMPELRDRVDHLYFPEANHMFTERFAQAELLDAITVWVDRSFR